jgi:hypothetical protein
MPCFVLWPTQQTLRELAKNLQLTRFTNRSAHLSFKAQRTSPIITVFSFFKVTANIQVCRQAIKLLPAIKVLPVQFLFTSRCNLTNLSTYWDGPPLPKFLSSSMYKLKTESNTLWKAWILCHKYSELRKLTSTIAHSEKSDQPIHNSVLHIRDLLDHEPLLHISL